MTTISRGTDGIVPLRISPNIEDACLSLACDSGRWTRRRLSDHQTGDMTEDSLHYRCAALLIWEHGEDAAYEAGLRADLMLDDGYLEGYRFWQRVLSAVRELQRSAPKKKDPPH